MTCWNSAEHTHALRQMSWMASTAVLMHLNERSTGDPARDWLSSWAYRFFAGDDLRILVLGCGEGWLERAVAEWPFVSRIDATDVAEEAVARAREGAGPKLHYSVADLNVAMLEPNAYDVVVAHSVLHHVENLEHCFDQIERAMKPDATLIVNEYAGPNRFQFSDDVLAIINDLLAALGYPPKERPTVEQMMASDPTEAVRAAELMPMIAERFEVLARKELGGTILMHLLYEIVQDFRWEDPGERSIIDLLCTFEGALVDARAIPSDFVLAAARKRGSRAIRSGRPLPPRPPAARDIERDPLRLTALTPASRTLSRTRERAPTLPLSRLRERVAEGRVRALAPWHLRVLRLALLSTQPRRANLFVESRVRGAVEQLRFAIARTSPFDWIVRRWSAYGEDPVVGALLEAFARIGAAKM
jgi:SAM-dependent methyltransferase